MTTVKWADIFSFTGDLSRDQAMARIDKIAEGMDELFTIPIIEKKVGLDAIFGLIPVVGDFLGGIFSLFIVYEAARLGASTSTLVKMVGNIAIDSIIGVVPVVGDLFDFVWKANRRNAALLKNDSALAVS